MATLIEILHVFILLEFELDERDEDADQQVIKGCLPERRVNIIIFRTWCT